MRIICIGNYPPRKCGIATFTENLVQSVLKAAKIHSRDVSIDVIAMNDPGMTYNYPDIVTHSINDRIKEEYVKMADYINHSGADLCLFQFEYGIFGGDSGLLILSLLRKLKIPIVSTLHTVLLQPTFHQKEVLRRIAEYSSRVVVMSSMAIGFLEKVFGIPRSKILRIEHGVPDFSGFDPKTAIRPDSWKNRKVLLTFGLIGRSKGIETVIKALPSVVEKHPEVLYVVLGKTHPHVVKWAGEEYREYLEKLTADLNLNNHVEFLNQYVSEEELMAYLLASDIYVTPYLNKAQITSGTLSYAVGGGSAVISTPYWHAEELLAEGRGRLFEFHDYEGLAGIVVELLNDPEKLENLKQRAFNYGLKIAWPKIGFEYLTAFENVIAEYKTHIESRRHAFAFTIPHFDPGQLERLTDDTGIIQHARGCIANYKTGYCLDDNTRAMIVCVMAHQKYGDQKYYPLIYRYLAYIMYMQNKDGSFKNYLTYGRNTIEEIGSDDAFGRSVWALGHLIRFAPSDSFFQISKDLFYLSVKNFDSLRYARGFANCIMGLYHYVHRYPDQEQFVKMLEKLADKLIGCFNTHSHDTWDWFEPTITYDNGLLPAALYQAYELTENEKYFEIAERTRKFIERKCMANGHLSLVGNAKWMKEPVDPNAEYAQQPVDALAMLIMYESAWKVTGNHHFIDKLKRSFEWFFGNNDLNLPLYDEETKGCNDGLEQFGVNRNQGAESIVAYLMSWLIAEPYFK